MFSSPAALLGSILFGAVDLGAFMYGKRMVLYKPMVIGVALMAYPSKDGIEAAGRVAA